MALEYTLGDLAEKVGVQVNKKAAKKKILAVAPLDVATSDHVSFLDNPAYKIQAEKTKAAAVFIREQEKALLPEGVEALVTENPYAAFARALQLFYPLPEVKGGVSKQAIVSKEAQIDPSARVEPGAVIYPGAIIGKGVHIGAYSIVGEHVQIGENTRVAPHVTIMNATVGAHCLIHSGVRIGQDGFGFAEDRDEIIKIPQVGIVAIEDHVEIGANTTIDRGALNETRIGQGTKIDNQVQIGHNVIVGPNCRIVAQVGVAGSTEIGAGSLIGGQAGLAGHIKLAEKTMVGGKAGVVKSVEKPGTVLAGSPAMPVHQWRRMQAVLRNVARSVTPQKLKGTPLESALRDRQGVEENLQKAQTEAEADLMQG